MQHHVIIALYEFYVVRNKGEIINYYKYLI